MDSHWKELINEVTSFTEPVSQVYPRTHNEEFCEVTPDRWSLPQLNRQLLAGEHTYNTVRPTRLSVTPLLWSSSSVATNPNPKASLIMWTSTNA